MGLSITKELLKSLTELDYAEETANNPILVNSLKDLESSISNLRGLLIESRVKLILSSLEQKDTDIYVQTMAKAGTTLAQMILYQMTTDGNMNFNHLYDVSPWYTFIARGSSTNFDEFIRNPTIFKNRKIIKSHLNYSMYTKLNKGKFVYIIRDGKDQLLSDYHQNKNYFGYTHSFEKFADSYMEKWFRINEEWLRNENNLPIIYIHYEDMINDKKKVIHKLADFFKIPITDEITDRVLEKTSFSFMKKNENKFGEQPQNTDKRIYDQFIRKGEIGNGENCFTEKQIEQYNNFSKKYLRTHKMTKRYFE